MCLLLSYGGLLLLNRPSFPFLIASAPHLRDDVLNETGIGIRYLSTSKLTNALVHSLRSPWSILVAAIVALDFYCSSQSLFCESTRNVASFALGILIDPLNIAFGQFHKDWPSVALLGAISTAPDKGGDCDRDGLTEDATTYRYLK